jgi:hypothetical protein
MNLDPPSPHMLRFLGGSSSVADFRRPPRVAGAYGNQRSRYQASDESRQGPPRRGQPIEIRRTPACAHRRDRGHCRHLQAAAQLAGRARPWGAEHRSSSESVRHWETQMVSSPQRMQRFLGGVSARQAPASRGIRGRPARLLGGSACCYLAPDSFAGIVRPKVPKPGCHGSVCGPVVAQTCLGGIPIAMRNGALDRPLSVFVSGFRRDASSRVVSVGAASQAEGRGFEARRPLSPCRIGPHETAANERLSPPDSVSRMSSSHGVSRARRRIVATFWLHRRVEGGAVGRSQLRWTPTADLLSRGSQVRVLPGPLHLRLPTWALLPGGEAKIYQRRDYVATSMPPRYEPGIASALLAGDGLGVGGGQALGRARTTARRRGQPEVLGTQIGHEVLPERGSAIGQ